MKNTKKHSPKKPLSAAEFDKKFDAGEDITGDLDLSSVRVFEPGEERLNLEIKKVNLDIPQWMIDGLDRAAERIGVTRQSIIKIWLADRLQGKAA